MDYQNLQLFGVSEIEKTPNGIKLFRYPKKVVERLGVPEYDKDGNFLQNYDAHKSSARVCIGIEIRFVYEGDSVEITLYGDKTATVMAFVGDYQIGFFKLAVGKNTIKLVRPQNSFGVKEKSCNRYPMHLWRIVPESDEPITFVALKTQGEYRLPEKTKRPTMLVYGSSISQGCGTPFVTMNYVDIATNLLGWEMKNKALAGGCFCEESVREFLLKEEFDCAYFELGTNIANRPLSLIEERVGKFIDTMCQAFPKKTLYFMTPIRGLSDVSDTGALPVLALEDDELTLLVDKNYEMGAVVLYKRAEQSDATYNYTIENTNIATVDANGNITTKACGETTITVTASWRGVQSTTLTQTAKVIVKENIKLNLSAEQTTLATANTTVEGTQYYNSVALDVEFLKNEVAETLDTSKCTWTSSEESVATVDDNGVVTAVGVEGETEILLTYTLDTGTYTSNAITVTVSVPTVDKTSSISVDLDANADTIADCLTAEKVFGAGTTITSVRATTDLSEDIYNDDAWLAEKDQGDEEERTYTLKVYNESYAYLVKAFVATKVITTASELASLQSYTTVTTGTNSKNATYYSYGGYFVLANNLTATGTESAFGANSLGSISSGTDMQSTYGFHGVFDGRGYKVDGFTYGVGGVFGDIGNNALIKNVAFTNATVGVNSRQNGVGVLSANANGSYTVSNVYVQGSLWGSNAGMLLGRSHNGGTFENIVIDMTVSDGTSATNDDSYTLGAISGWDAGSNETFTNVTIVYGNTASDVKQSKATGNNYEWNNSGNTMPKEYQKQADGTVKKITAKTGSGNAVTAVTLGNTATVADFNGYNSAYWTVTAGYAPVFKTKA